MMDYTFIKTDDGSVGLFDNLVNDIYHSKSGAKKEAFQKFVEPILNLNKEKINVLDICFGIGYNSKTLIECSKYNYINIDALDLNFNLIALSPFIKDGIYNQFIKLQLLKNLLNKFQGINEYVNCLKSQIDISNFSFFDKNMLDFMEFLSNLPYKNIVELQNNSNLHNIYYNYITERHSEKVFCNNNINFDINFHIGDARKTLKNLNDKYDVIFLDGFSPQKSPLLWTINFIQEIKLHMHADSILTSYSKSTPFRNTLKQLGFYVGKTFIDNVDMGTVASLNNANIINQLSEYDLLLLNTRSGIPYRDNEFMNLSVEEIIKNRDFEQKNSTLLSQTQFLKKYKNSL